MKKLTLILAVMTVTLAAISCGPKKTQSNEESPKEEPTKTLVLYYSLTGNTKAVAQEIATRLNADMEEIVAVDPYDPDFETTINRCLKEREEGTVTKIQPIAADLSKYDVICIGYPVWFGTFAPPVATFLDSYDLSGKTVVPFCTFGSGGLPSSIKDLAQRQPNARIIGGYGVRAARLAAMPQEVEQFLIGNHFIEGEYIQLGDFSDLQPVNDEEASIFAAATGNYEPKLNAIPELVGSRAIPGGTEYLYIAKDLPRKDMPNMPPAGEMKVYVTVLDGQEPVFTQVVR